MTTENKTIIATLLSARNEAARELRVFIAECEKTDSPFQLGDLVKYGSKKMSITSIKLRLAESTERPQWAFRGRLLKKDGTVGLLTGFVTKDYD